MKIVLGLITFTALSMPVTWAQTAELSGFVKDSTGSVVPNAQLKILSRETGITRETTTNEDGVYSFPALQPGIYDLDTSASAFKKFSRLGLKLEVAQKARLDITLEVGQVSEVITVSGDTLLLNTSDASVGTVVDRTFVQNIPLNGRSLQSLVTTAPGVVITKPPYGSRGDRGEFSVNGQRTEANYFTVDGASGNFGLGGNGLYGVSGGGGTPNSTALGTTHGLISLDALQEFRIQTSSYSAEYGRTPGAQISLTSRSGSNEFHGSLFNYFRNDKMDANNWFNNRAGIGKTPERQNDFGGTLGGPVILPGYSGRNRTFFFVSYEGLRLRIPQGASTVQVPELEVRRRLAAPLQAILSVFPTPNGGPVLLPDSKGVLQPSGLAYYTYAASNPAAIDNVSIRIDQRLNDRLNVFGRFQSSPSTQDSPGAGIVSYGGNKNRVFYLGGDWTTTPRLVNQTRFNSSASDRTLEYELFRHGLDGARTGQRYTFDDFFTEEYPTFTQASVILQWGGNPAVNLVKNGNAQTQWNLVDTLSWTTGKHSFKFGGDYRQTSTTHGVRQLWVRYRYLSLASLLANSAEEVPVSAQSFGQIPVYKNYSFFGHDEWRLSPSLTLSLGLRWDINPAPKNGNGWQPPALSNINGLTAAPQGSSLYSTDYLGLGPRIGAAYRLSRASNRETVLRAGYGIFFDTGHSAPGNAFINAGFLSGTTYSGLPFPLPSQYYQIPKPTLTPPFTALVVAFNPNLKLPYSDHWNVTVEQRLGTGRSLTVAYVGSAGHRLHHAFVKSAPVEFVTGRQIIDVENAAYSNYNAMQLKFQQAVQRGLQVLTSYTWSHSIDTGSSDADYYDVQRKGDSDFDQRQVFQAAVTYDIPRIGGPRLTSALVNGWGIDTRVAMNTSGVLDPNLGNALLPSGLQQTVRPDIVPGQPNYVYGPQYPGGVAINYSALRRTTDPSGFGNAPRNFFRLFGASQTSIALRRNFRMTEGLQLQFRGEAFNVFNHPNFGNVQLNWSSGPATFGQATATLNSALGGLNALYQLGGPRSLQLALKLAF